MYFLRLSNDKLLLSYIKLGDKKKLLMFCLQLLSHAQQTLADNICILDTSIRDICGRPTTFWLGSFIKDLYIFQIQLDTFFLTG